jgi:hypothetical protein
MKLGNICLSGHKEIHLSELSERPPPPVIRVCRLRKREFNTKLFQG